MQQCYISFHVMKRKKYSMAKSAQNWWFEGLAQYSQVYTWALWNHRNNTHEFLCRSIRNTEVSEYISQQLVRPLGHFEKSELYILRCFAAVCVDQTVKNCYPDKVLLVAE